ncbi:MAG: hypothetical protein JO130_10525 [Solirubrobacterales bacterium]|nr:hypothetical protein [Solirubrobacterales bacterium]
MTLHPLAADYLERLEHAARSLPRGERRELVAEINAHLAEATDPQMSDAEVLTVLDRLGEPEDIVAAQSPDQPAPRQGPGTQEWVAIVLLLAGGFIVFVGWIVGAVMLWTSRAWRVRDKLIGTLIVPGGLPTAILVLLDLSTPQTCTSLNGGPQHCVGGPSTLHQILSLGLFAFLVLGPIFTAVYLARRAR